MASGEQRHAQIVKLFRGDFGEDLYSNAGLRGPAGSAKAELLSYAALYPNGDVTYTRVTSNSLTRDQAERQLLRLSYPQDRTQIESKHARAVVVGAPADVDDAIWMLGVGQVKRYGLPVIFVTWKRILETNTSKITLWYPSVTRGNWALARLRRAVVGN